MIIKNQLYAEGIWINDKKGKVTVGQLFKGNFADYRDSGSTTVNGLALIDTKKGFMNGKFNAYCGVIEFNENWNIPGIAEFRTNKLLHISTKGGIQYKRSF